VIQIVHLQTDQRSELLKFRIDAACLAFPYGYAQTGCETADLVAKHHWHLGVQSCKLSLVSPHPNEVVCNLPVDENVHQPVQIISLSRYLDQHSSVVPTFGLKFIICKYFVQFMY
jgi:hypothetical protein